MKNIFRPNEFSQVCIWPGVTITEEESKNFSVIMSKQFDIRTFFMEVIETLPDKENGIDVPETGGRHDLIFAVHNEDVGKFAVPRLMVGIRWIEDVLSSCNYSSPIYPERVFKYKTWMLEDNSEVA